MIKVLVSSCLLGEAVRYHGGDARLASDILDRWHAEGRLVPICPETAGGLFATDSGGTAALSVCRRGKVLHWTADMDIDCDGKTSAACNLSTDPYFQNQTSAVDSMGDPLDSAALPFVVVPGPSTRFNYRTAGLASGSVFAVLYGDRVEYGVVGDTGPVAIIGEASHAMATSLGIRWSEATTALTESPIDTPR